MKRTHRGRSRPGLLSAAAAVSIVTVALLAAALQPEAPDRPVPAERVDAPHPLWTGAPAPPADSTEPGPTYVQEPEEFSIQSENGVHAGIMAF